MIKHNLDHFPQQPIIVDEYGNGLKQVITRGHGADGWEKKLGVMTSREYAKLMKKQAPASYAILKTNVIDMLDEYDKRRLPKEPEISWLSKEEIEKKFRNIRPEAKIQTYYVGV